MLMILSCLLEVDLILLLEIEALNFQVVKNKESRCFVNVSCITIKFSDPYFVDIGNGKAKISIIENPFPFCSAPLRHIRNSGNRCDDFARSHTAFPTSMLALNAGNSFRELTGFRDR